MMAPRILMTVVALAWGLIFAVAQGSHPQHTDVRSNGPVWLLGRKLVNGSYAVSCEEQLLIALSPDNTSVIYYDLKSRTSETSPLKHQGTSVLLAAGGEVVIVTHDSYVTVINLRERNQNYTVPSPVNSRSAFVAGNLLCAAPNSIYHYYSDDYYQYSNGPLSCLTISTRRWETCNDLGFISLGYFVANKNGSALYVLSYQQIDLVTLEVIEHYTVDGNCIDSNFCREVIFNCRPGACSQDTQRAWFSYDESAIFRQHGLVLSSVAQYAMDCVNDLIPLGHLDYEEHDVGTYTYRYISQLPENPHTIAALREDNLELVRLYSWPDLTFTKTMAIPKVGTLLSSEEVHYCSADQLYVIATYDTGSAGVQSGVAYFA